MKNRNRHRGEAFATLNREAAAAAKSWFEKNIKIKLAIVARIWYITTCRFGGGQVLRRSK
ncbi:hypothetical protein N0M98_24245 [Paenibacillus doosanensis]|uniref:hypothetical protein n=1 Tax=Paenibacillus konkukensis TaxID=2020716 RepID=UPI00201E7444|nr:hypothetical protein [Paenibacillus konkukensis]MCS7463238.1 hypothetical protein [Paenibacillus doosanensis]